jgi:hypothetical protein
VKAAGQPGNTSETETKAGQLSNRAVNKASVANNNGEHNRMSTPTSGVQSVEEGSMLGRSGRNGSTKTRVGSLSIYLEGFSNSVGSLTTLALSGHLPAHSNIRDLCI